MAGEGEAAVAEQMNNVSLATNGTTEPEEEEDIVDPWKVESKSAKGVDYDKLISKNMLLQLSFDI